MKIPLDSKQSSVPEPASADESAACVWAVGLMTGTVLDGNIDVALLKTDGQRIADFGDYRLAPYKPATVELLRQCQQQALEWQFEGPEPEVFARAQEQLTIEQSDAVAQLLKQSDIDHDAVSVVGFHGQTVLHRAPSHGQPGLTRQLSDGALMAKRLGINVVDDFRSADMRNGGQGAPLSAVYHRALLQRIGAGADTAVLNLGGVANLSWWDGADSLIAFDTGPANAPINDFVRSMGYADYDDGGRLADSGIVDESRLSELLQHPYLQASYPKSLDRFDFTAHIADGLDLADGAALLTAFSASAVAVALDLLRTYPRRLIVCGGGRHNHSLMRMLQERTGTEVVPAEVVGWRGDAIEAECFAFLAVRSMQSQALSFPQTTGVQSPTCGGVLHRWNADNSALRH